MSIGKKLLAGFGFCTFLLIVVAFLGISSNNTMKEGFTEIIEVNLPVDTMVADLGFRQMEQVAALRGYILYRDDSFIETFKNIGKEKDAIYLDIEDKIETEQSKEMLNTLKGLSKSYSEVAEEIFILVH